MQFRVNASALRVRATPTRTGDKLGVLTNGTVVTTLDDPSPTPGWVRIVWNGAPGYCSADFLVPVSVVVPPAAPVALAPLAAPPVDQRDRDLSHLHPVVREALKETIATLNAEGLPFQIFEAYRSPERQMWLYAQGRTRPGGIVTKAQAWRSMHQYGLGADVVLFEGGKWSWGGQASQWRRMHQVAAANGLQHLDFETPHLELQGADWSRYLAGNLPDGGDITWYENLARTAARWRASGKQPSGPMIDESDRPPLDQLMTA